MVPLIAIGACCSLPVIGAILMMFWGRGGKVKQAAPKASGILARLRLRGK